jgi:hypothetical protein
MRRRSLWSYGLRACAAVMLALLPSACEDSEIDCSQDIDEVSDESEVAEGFSFAPGGFLASALGKFGGTLSSDPAMPVEVTLEVISTSAVRYTQNYPNLSCVPPHYYIEVQLSVSSPNGALNESATTHILLFEPTSAGTGYGFFYSRNEVKGTITPPPSIPTSGRDVWLGVKMTFLNGSWKLSVEWTSNPSSAGGSKEHFRELVGEADLQPI